MATNKNIDDLVINKVETQAVYDYMQANGLINNDELYLVGGDGECVLYTSQELTEEQKEQARINIGAVSTSDLTIVTTSSAGLMSSTDKIKLNDIEEGATKSTITLKTWTAADMT